MRPVRSQVGIFWGWPQHLELSNCKFCNSLVSVLENVGWCSAVLYLSLLYLSRVSIYSDTGKRADIAFPVLWRRALRWAVVLDQHWGTRRFLLFEIARKCHNANVILVQAHDQFPRDMDHLCCLISLFHCRKITHFALAVPKHQPWFDCPQGAKLICRINMIIFMSWAFSG
jgi:hypothetical protein